MITRGCGYTNGTRPSKEEQGLRCWQSTCRRYRKDSHFEGPPSYHPFLNLTGYLSALTTSAFPWSCHSFIFYSPASSAPTLLCPHLKTFFFHHWFLIPQCTTCLPSSTVPVFIPLDPITSFIPYLNIFLTCFSEFFCVPPTFCSHIFFLSPRFSFCPHLKIYMSPLFLDS